MAYKLFVTQAAHEDLEETLDYIAGNLSNPGAAVKLLDEVEASTSVTDNSLLVQTARTQLFSIKFRQLSRFHDPAANTASHLVIH